MKLSNKKASILLLKWGTKGGIETVGADIARVLLELNYEVTICARSQLEISDRLRNPDLRFKRLFPNNKFLRRIWFRFLIKFFGPYLFAFHCKNSDLVVVTHLNLLPDCVRIKGSKLFVWLHGIEAWGRSHYLNQFAPIIDKLICVSKFTQEQLGDDLKVSSTVIYNAVDTQRFRSSCLANRSGKVNIMTCGRLVRGRPKGHETLIKAARILMDENVEFNKIYVVGDGDDRQRLETMVHDEGLSHKIKFVGEVTDDVLLSYYKKSDIFVMLAETNLQSQNLYGEGLGIVCLEAAAFGLPVITSDYGGTAETVVNNETGYLLPPSDEHQCADRLKRLILEQDLRRDLGCAGRKMVVAQFSYQNFKRSISKIL